MAAYDDDYQSSFSTVDEQVKRAARKADTAAQKAAAEKAAATEATAAALRKLTGGQTLTDAERVMLGMTPAGTPAAGPIGPTLTAEPTGVTTSTNPVAPTFSPKPTNPPGTTRTVVSTYVDPTTGDVYAIYSDGSRELLSKGNKLAEDEAAKARAKLLAEQEAKLAEEKKLAERQSAYDLLYSQFKQYGLESLVEGIKGLIQSNVSPSEFAIRLQDTDAYKKRFAANQERIKQGLRALTPAEYIGLEDQYQNIMRNYGLPASYYTKDSMGTQQGFEKFLANDVSAAELEDRIATAQKRVLNTNPEVLQALKQFYPDLNNSDILAYTLDPTRALEEIKRKVTAAEIGGAALAQGLQASGGTAESLAGYGITKAQAQQGYQTIGEFLPTAQKLGDIYAEQGLGGYDQATAEREVFGTQGAASAAQKRRKLAQLEQATFGGQAGTSQGAFDRGRQGTF